jgi:hypothetical protein
MTHYHYDIAQIRAAHASAMAQLKAQLVGKPKDSFSPERIALSFELADLLLEASVACFEARNNGTSEAVVAVAFGTAVGNMAGNFIQNALSNGDFASAGLFHDRMMSIIDRHITANDAGAVHGSAEVLPMQGSRA